MSHHTEAEKLKTSICPACEGIGTVAITPVSDLTHDPKGSCR